MTSLLTSARDASNAQVVAVAYADVGGAGTRRRVLDAAASARVAGVLLDIGPGNVLSGLLKRIDSSVKAISVNDLKSLDAATLELA